MKKGLVSVCVVTMNNKEWLGKSLTALQNQSYKQIEIFVIDNGSTDGTETYIAKKFPDVFYTRLPKNVGYGKAANIAIKKARGEFFLIYNDDAICQKSFLKILVATLNTHPELAGCQGKVLTFGTQTLQSCGSYMTPIGVLIKSTHTKKFSYVFNMNLPLLRTDLVRKVGLFDEDYFLYFEEADLSWRLLLTGKKLAYTPNAVIAHVGGQTTQKLPSPFIINSTFHNRFNSLIKNLEGFSLLLFIPAHLLFCLVAIFVYLVNAKFAQSYAIIRAVGQNIIELPETLQKRRVVQKKRAISDAVLFRQTLSPMTLTYFLTEGKKYVKQWK